MLQCILMTKSLDTVVSKECDPDYWTICPPDVDSDECHPEVNMCAPDYGDDGCLPGCSPNE